MKINPFHHGYQKRVTMGIVAILGMLLSTQCTAVQNFSANKSRTSRPGNSNSTAITLSWMESYSKHFSNLKQYKVLVYPTLLSASYDNIENNGTTLPVVNEDLNMLEATGASGITIHMGYDPWIINLPNIVSEDTTVCNEIRGDNKTLMLADASAEYYRHHKLPWNLFKTVWIKRVTTLARLCRPAYYTVIKEPPWYVPMIAGLQRNASNPADKLVSDPSQWISLLSQLISAVKSVSPNTKVGIAVSGDLYNGSIGGKVDSQILQSAIHLKGLNYIGFDIYTPTAFENTAEFLQKYGSGGKSIWIAEAWDATAPTSSINSVNTQTGVAWAQFLFKFARYIKAVGVVPFYSDNFASYKTPLSGTSNLLAFYNERTQLFYEFQKLISHQKNLEQLFTGAPSP